ncbi:MAG TPA: cation diffusion facilitator family transporter [Sedimentisphaerales bacterium]|nr:cation diffusion facilitator family transporter [Sedimentisphaerales bacterium]
MQLGGKAEIQSGKIRRITNISLVLNIVLSAAKVIVGVLMNSMALIADGMHSLSDMATDVALLVGVHFGSKMPDAKHPYGHGRMETFVAVVIAVVLIIVGLGLVYRAGYDIVHHRIAEPSILVIIVAIISIVSKEWLYQATRKVAKETHSPATYANAWHHRSDALSSVAVVLGVGSMYLGFRYGDEIATVAVGIIIAMVGFSIMSDSVGEFAERAVDQATYDRITGILKANPAIHTWHKLRTRIVGREIFLDLHILVDPGLSITRAHEISEQLETSLHDHLDRPVNITVHVEPDTSRPGEQGA